jgi:hypothetical protein
MYCSIRLTIRCGFRPSLKTALGVFPAWLLLLPLLLLSAACHQSVHPPPAPARNSVGTDSQAKAAQAHSGISFATRQKFLDHYGKHGAEFGSISKEEYLRQAQELRDRLAGGDVLEVTRADGVVTRFDKQTGAFLAFNSDLTIRTFFKPNDGENYFRRQRKRPASRSGREE